MKKKEFVIPQIEVIKVSEDIITNSAGSDLGCVLLHSHETKIHMEPNDD